MNQTTGTLTAQMLIKEDAGSFTCLAENNAGRIEASVALVVVLKPIVEELEKKTYAKGGTNIHNITRRMPKGPRPTSPASPRATRCPAYHGGRVPTSESNWVKTQLMCPFF